MTINEKLEKLREKMEKYNLDCYLEHNVDPHQSEYVADRWKTREWLSGFTGSVGTLVVTSKKSALWADGRYYIQAEKELNGSEIKLQKKGLEKTSKVHEWLSKNLKNNAKIGLNGKTYSEKYVSNLKKNITLEDIEFITRYDIVDELWKDRPEIPRNKAFIHPPEYAGKTRAQKIKNIRKKMKEKKCSHLIISTLDDIAWTLNIRGNDIKFNPYIISYLLIENDNISFYVLEEKIDKKIKKQLEKDNISLKNYSKIVKDLQKLSKKDKVWYSPETTNMWIVSSISEEANKYQKRVPTKLMKAKKNKKELKNLKNCQIKDGIAMVKFLIWLEETIKEREIGEVEAAQKVNEFRKRQKYFIEPSFSPISAYKENAAMMHYHAKEENQSFLKNKSFYLLDSGGQYMDGTTDITRTIPMGVLSREEKFHYTLTLKGHINLANSKFLYGATGSNLDVLSRKPLWEHNLDYKCGTGHGVGYLMGVHEGPQNISRTPNKIKLEEGMIVTIEPGIYIEGSHGIRIENDYVIVKDKKNNSDQFMKFKNMTYCPIDTQPIIKDLLTEEEIKWLNDFHSKVFDKLAKHLNEEERTWLKKKTKKL
ncbi:MAG: aminopeptidase P family protein [Candidatus Mcinerneyibacterium aminivorans]|uniref:Aminopeptidase P family protein n=1 Tax=Candidatus Mcinerneyibacterium aminivorans TaxID=2703815 RepID=A0A5D0MIS4_9BACT|nr:MAG: aminopeptidase P family protein [Candidatus Mcinerneyibacterium aminivorans]